MAFTSLWSFGDVIMEEYDVTVPSDMEPGTYDISVGLENDRLMLSVVSGKDKTDRAIIAEIEII